MSQHTAMMKTYLNDNNDKNDNNVINHIFLIYIF